MSSPSPSIYNMESHFDELKSLVPPPQVLKREGYRLVPFKPEEMRKLVRCKDCLGRIRKKYKSHQRIMVAEKELRDIWKDSEMERGVSSKGKEPAHTIIGNRYDTASPRSIYSASRSVISSDTEDGGISLRFGERDGLFKAPATKVGFGKGKRWDENKEQDQKPKCHYHPGRIITGLFTCCNGHRSSPGCVERDYHIPQEYILGELEKKWRLHKTPGFTSPMHRKAVALDCQMGIATTGDLELVRLSMVDYFTGEILVDTPVYPSVPMLHYTTQPKYSGLSDWQIELARNQGECLNGRDEARRFLWRFVGPDTIVIAHGGKFILMALRWIHEKVIDTFMVESARNHGCGVLSLKSLAVVYLDREPRKEDGNDSLEDAKTCRKLVKWYLGH